MALRASTFIVLMMIRNLDTFFTGAIENLRIESPQHVINMFDSSCGKSLTAVAVHETFCDPKGSIWCESA